MTDRQELARRLHKYAERMEAGEVLEAVGLVDDLNDAAEELAAEEKKMNPKLKAFLLGAAEALAVGFTLGVGSVWVKPEDVLFTKEGVLLVFQTGVQVAVIYLLGYLRKHVAFREVWTPERRAVEAVK